MGFDRHSELGDPLFVDPSTNDYRLRPSSPAGRLGFVPVDLSNGRHPAGADDEFLKLERCPSGVEGGGQS